MKEFLAIVFVAIFAIFCYVAVPLGLITMIYWILSIFFGWVFWFPIVLAIYGIFLLFKWLITPTKS